MNVVSKANAMDIKGANREFGKELSSNNIKSAVGQTQGAGSKKGSAEGDN